MTRYLKGFVKICDPDQCAALSVLIKNGRNYTSRKTVFTKSSRHRMPRLTAQAGLDRVRRINQCLPLTSSE